MKQHIAIIGNGISGITAARHIRKLDDECRITVISGETDHFFARTAIMYIYMGHMRYEDTKPYEDWFWKKNRIDLERAWVRTIDTDVKQLVFTNDRRMEYDKLIVAVGSKPNKFGWPGQGLDGVQGLYSYQDLQLMEENTRKIDRAVIVGGGLIGVEMAEMLDSRNIPVTFLVREPWFWGNVLPEEEGRMISRHIKEDHHIDLRLGTGLKSIEADKNGRAKGIYTGGGEFIACQFVGLTPGVSPNIGMVEQTNIKTDKGVLVNEYFETNVEDVYAIGDCAQFFEHPTGRKPIEQVWYTGRMMGETIAHTVCGFKTRYKPGVWFNSAKFFDIEYMTYGDVPNKLREGAGQFYWEAPDGKKCLRFVFDSRTKRLKGINAFGIRVRHAVCDHWIKTGKTIGHCLQHFRDANFDPEFFKSHESGIIAQYNRDFNASLKPLKFSWKRLLKIA